MESKEIDEDYSIEISNESIEEGTKNKSFRNNKKGKKLHTIESKLEIIKYARENSVKEAIKKYNVPYTTLQDWIKNEDKFLNIPNSKLNKKTLHKGSSIMNPELDIKILNYIEFNRKLSNPITFWSLLSKIYEYAPERKNKSFKSNQLLIYRILKRNNYTFKAKTPIGNTLGEVTFNEATKFVNEVWDLRKQFGYNDKNMGSMDETPLFFNMPPSKKVFYKGPKPILIKTQEQDKCRISILLAITADGGRLPPYIIFKAKKHGNVEKKLQKDLNVITNRCFVVCNENACSTDEIIKDWYLKVWLKYLFNNNERKGYLILDRACLKSNELLNLFNQGSKNASFIPGGLTRFFQPLDVSINKTFKQALKEKYVEFCLSNINESGYFKISRTKMIQYICEVWYDEHLISKDMIYKSFRETGLGNKLDRTEDNLFESWPRMKNEIPLIEADLEEDAPIQLNNEVSDEGEDFIIKLYWGIFF